jgi:hypothetical protein
VLIKGLIVQLLEAYPSVATKNLRRLSMDRFHAVGTTTKSDSGPAAWKLLEDMLRLIEAAPEAKNRNMLILVDRLDLCYSEEHYSVMEDLIPGLQSLNRRLSRVQVLITTARISPLGVPTLLKGSEWLRAYGKKAHG